MKKGLLKYEGCGLPDVYLVNGFRVEDSQYGQTVAIEDVEGLHAAIADALLDKRSRLSGAEFRFLRRLLELSQRTCGELFGVDAQSIASWEKNNKVSNLADVTLRNVVRQSLGGNVQIVQLLQMLNESDRREHERRRKLVFKPTRDGWRLASAA